MISARMSRVALDARPCTTSCRAVVVYGAAANEAFLMFLLLEAALHAVDVVAVDAGHLDLRCVDTRQRSRCRLPEWQVRQTADLSSAVASGLLSALTRLGLARVLQVLRWHRRGTPGTTAPLASLVAPCAVSMIVSADFAWQFAQTGMLGRRRLWLSERGRRGERRNGRQQPGGREDRLESHVVLPFPDFATAGPSRRRTPDPGETTRLETPRPGVGARKARPRVARRRDAFHPARRGCRTARPSRRAAGMSCHLHCGVRVAGGAKRAPLITGPNRLLADDRSMTLRAR